MMELKEAMREIFHCPHCRGEAYEASEDGFTIIRCGTCGCRTDAFFHTPSAIAAWNRRA